MQKGYKYKDVSADIILVGVDEVGRGCLCGPVIAVAVVSRPEVMIDGLNDSKKLTEKKREIIFNEICRNKIKYAVGRAEAEEIDSINILQASLLAMKRAIKGLTIIPDLVLVDGNYCPEVDCPVNAIVGGDGLISEIAIASIIAKVIRDREMIALDNLYPGYGIAKHKGYPTQQHIEGIKKFGILPIHRRSFAPIRKFSKI